MFPGTQNVCHRGSHMEGTVCLKEALVARGVLEHATVRSPLLSLAEGAHDEIAVALASAGLGLAKVPETVCAVGPQGEAPSVATAAVATTQAALNQQSTPVTTFGVTGSPKPGPRMGLV